MLPVQQGLTLFSPSPNGRMHLGHVWCAFMNWAFGKEEGVILHFEDETVRQTNTVAEVELQAYMQDFQAGFEKMQIPVAAVVVQSSRMTRYDQVNHAHFEGRLDWDIALPLLKVVHDCPSMGFYSVMPGLGMLCWVVDDHDFGVPVVVNGAELQFARGLYHHMFKMSFPEDWEQTIPIQRYIAPVYERNDDGTEAKLSKSITRTLFVNDLDIKPWPTLWNLAGNQMTDTKMSGPLKNVKTVSDLRKWVALAKPVPDPFGITAADAEGWSST